MTNDAITAALSRSDLFGGLDPLQQARLARECHVRAFDKGRQVFARGDAGDVMYVVGQGSVALSIGSADGAEVILAVVKPPQTFGELALIDHGARIATATAREATKLVIVPSASVRPLLHTNPSIAISMLSALARLIRQMDDRAADLVLLDLPGRVGKFIMAAAGPDVHRLQPPAEVPVDLQINQTDLARLVGGSRQQVNRIINALEDQGAIRREGSRIVSVRPDRLTST